MLTTLDDVRREVVELRRGADALGILADGARMRAAQGDHMSNACCIAMRLQPRASRIVVIAGVSDVDKAIAQQAKRDFPQSIYALEIVRQASWLSVVRFVTPAIFVVIFIALIVSLKLFN